MRDSELAALESMRRHRVNRGWLLKITALVVYMVLAAWALL